VDARGLSPVSEAEDLPDQGEPTRGAHSSGATPIRTDTALSRALHVLATSPPGDMGTDHKYMWRLRCLLRILSHSSKDTLRSSSPSTMTTLQPMKETTLSEAPAGTPGPRVWQDRRGRYKHA